MAKTIRDKRDSSKPRSVPDPPSALAARSRSETFEHILPSRSFTPDLPPGATWHFKIPLEADIRVNDIAASVAKSHGEIHVRPRFRPTPWALETLEIMLSRFVSRLADKPVAVRLHRKGVQHPQLHVRLEDAGAPIPEHETDPDLRMALELRRWADSAAEALAGPSDNGRRSEAERNAYKEAVRRAWAAIHGTDNRGALRHFIESVIVQRGEHIQPNRQQSTTAKTADEQNLSSLAKGVLRDVRSVAPELAKDLKESSVIRALKSVSRRGKKGGPPKGEQSWAVALSRVIADLGLADIDSASHARSVRRTAKRKARPAA